MGHSFHNLAPISGKKTAPIFIKILAEIFGQRSPC